MSLLPYTKSSETIVGIFCQAHNQGLTKVAAMLAEGHCSASNTGIALYLAFILSCKNGDLDGAKWLLEQWQTWIDLYAGYEMIGDAKQRQRISFADEWYVEACLRAVLYDDSRCYLAPTFQLFKAMIHQVCSNGDKDTAQWLHSTIVPRYLPVSCRFTELEDFISTKI